MARPKDKRVKKMGRRIRRNEDWCPECGYLLARKKWNCQFCGWSLYESQVIDWLDEKSKGDERWKIFISNHDGKINRLIYNDSSDPMEN